MCSCHTVECTCMYMYIGNSVWLIQSARLHCPRPVCSRRGRLCICARSKPSGSQFSAWPCDLWTSLCSDYCRATQAGRITARSFRSESACTKWIVCIEKSVECTKVSVQLPSHFCVTCYWIDRLQIYLGDSIISEKIKFFRVDAVILDIILNSQFICKIIDFNKSYFCHYGTKESFKPTYHYSCIILFLSDFSLLHSPCAFQIMSLLQWLQQGSAQVWLAYQIPLKLEVIFHEQWHYSYNSARRCSIVQLRW